MTSERHPRCPLCGGPDLQDRFRVDGFTISRCGGCRLVFVREIVSNEALSRHYSDSEGDGVYVDAENEENLKFYDRKLRGLIESRVPGGRLLDVGCDRGRFLDSMDGWERHGIEIFAPLAEAAKARYGDRIHCGTLDDYPGPENYFDVVTMLDTFDHMPRPLEALERCRRLLKPGGLLAIKVHDISCWYARLAGSRFYAIIPPSHLFYYRKSTLALALERSGFRLSGSWHLPHRLFLKTIPYRLARGRQTGLAASAYRFLSRRAFGRIPIRKNLHDLITVFGVKAGESDSVGP